VILALNTAQSTHELALLNGDKLLSERRWVNAKEDVEKLIPTVQEMLDEAGATKKDLTELVIVRGPGSFTSVRVGIAFMNALAEGLHARLFTLDTFELLTRKAATTDPVLVVLHAGGLDVGIQIFSENRLNKPKNRDDSVPGNNFKVGPLAPMLAEITHDQSLRIVAELPETLMDELRSIVREKQWTLLEGHELQTLGESLATLGLQNLELVDTVTPLYLRGAHITVSKDPWKQAK
jgi:tRNA threonylcarbamoyl adenosine modification protein YeaZ